MLGELTNHIWQSTLFAALTGLLTLAFRKNRAQVRYCLWLSASLKFLLPFSLLIGLGSRFEWAPVTQKMSTAPAVSFTLAQMSQPFSGSSASVPSARDTHDWIGLLLLGVWACGFSGVALIRCRGWRRIRAA